LSFFLHSTGRGHDRKHGLVGVAEKEHTAMVLMIEMIFETIFKLLVI
jgi:hypothetical protein